MHQADIKFHATDSSQPHSMNNDSTPRKVALFGVFGVGNLGNECTLQAMIGNLRDRLPEAQITCICSGPDVVQSTYGVPAIPIREVFFARQPNDSRRALRILRKIFVAIPSELYRWFKIAKVLRRQDMLVMTGTGMLGDFGIGPFDLHYDILRWSILARLCGCKVLFVSVGAGPIRNRLSRWFVTTALAFANYRSYRDDFSKNYLKSVGFHANGDAVYPDLAFSLSFPRDGTSQSTDRKDAVVGLGIMTYFNRRHSSEGGEGTYKGYIDKLAAFATWLVRHGYNVRLLIGDAAYDGRVRQDLKAQLDTSGLREDELQKILDEPAASADDVLAQIADSDIVVASRFHNVLLALMLGKPVLAISYHEKVDALLAGVGLQQFRQDIEHIDLEQLVLRFLELEENIEPLKLQIETKTKGYRRALTKQYDHIIRQV